MCFQLFHVESLPQNTQLSGIVHLFFQSEAPSVLSEYYKHAQTLNCWVLLIVMKGQVILPHGELHMSVSKNLSGPTSFLHKTTFQSAALEGEE